jgi:hypothetical protein
MPSTCLRCGLTNCVERTWVSPTDQAPANESRSAAVDHRKPRGGREHKRTAPPVPQPTPHLKHLLGSDEIKCKRQLIWIERTQSSIGDDRNTTNAGGTRSFETLGSSTSAPKDHDIRASR